MSSRTNRQYDAAVEEAVTAGERQYAASLDPDLADSFDSEGSDSELRRCDLCGSPCRQEYGDGEIVLDGKHLIVCEGCAVENKDNLA